MKRLNAKSAVGCWAMIINDKNQVLLIKNNKFSRNHWECPGGKIEVGETIKDTILREVKEETNIRIKILNNISIVEYYNEEDKTYWICLGYAAKYLFGQLKTSVSSILDIRWFDVDKLPKEINATNKQVIKKYFNLE